MAASTINYAAIGNGRPRIGCRATFNVPVIASTPPVDSPLAYNKDKTISVINDIYKLFLNPIYLPPLNAIFLPEDTGRRNVNSKFLSKDYDISPTVISLVQRLPYVIEF
jgi:hypothetical protein